MSLSKYSGKKGNEPMCAVKIYLKMVNNESGNRLKISFIESYIKGGQ